jgi:hypothetical protein
MNFNHNHYVPCLQWKQGEYLAISGLSKTAKSFITPLIEVPEIGFDFETWSASKEIDEHLDPFAKRVHSKWGDSPCFVDLVRLPPDKTMADGRHPISFVFDRLRNEGCSAVPVTGLARDRRAQDAIKQVVLKDKLGLGLRIGIGEAAGAKVKDEIEKLLAGSGLKAEYCDLIVDIGAPNFEPVEGFTKLIESLLRRLPHLSRWRTLTLVGTGFPSTMAEIKQSVEYIKRWEWIAYKKLVNSIQGSLRLPTFGDFAINHPNSISVDMRLVKPSATIRYTIDDGWLIVKGPNVRDNGYDQFRLHSRTVLNSKNFMGSSFSQGDKFIEACAAGSVGTGNLTTWRKVGTSHHIEKVVRDISRLFGSSNAP